MLAMCFSGATKYLLNRKVIPIPPEIIINPIGTILCQIILLILSFNLYCDNPTCTKPKVFCFFSLGVSSSPRICAANSSSANAGFSKTGMVKS